MSSFVNADLGSDSDSDDADFNPETEVNIVSEEDNSGDEEHADGGASKAKKRKKVEQGWNMRLPEDHVNDKEEKEIKEAFEKEKEELKMEAEKQKTEDLWSGNNHVHSSTNRLLGLLSGSICDSCSEGS